MASASEQPGFDRPALLSGMKRLPKKGILVSAFALALCIQLAIGALSYRNTAGLIQTADSVRHTQEVVHRLEDLLGDLATSPAIIHRKVTYLRALTADNDPQQRFLDVLEPLVQAELARRERTYDSREGKGSSAAAKTRRPDQPEVQIAEVISQMEDQEQRLLVERSQAAKASSRKTFITLFIGTAVSFALLLAVFNFLSRETSERQRAEQVSHGQTETLMKTLSALAAESKLERFSGQVLAAIAEQFNAHSASLWLYDPSRGILQAHTLYEQGQVRQAADLAELNRESTTPEFLGWQEFARERGSLVLRDVETNAMLAPIRDWLVSRGIRTVLCAPLVAADEIIGCIALSSTEHREYERQELELVQALAQQLSLAIQLTRLAEKGQRSAVLEERNRMAREIHDTLAQGFTGIVVQLEAAEDVLAENPDAACEHMRQAENLARQSLAEARTSVQALRPPPLETADLAGALNRLASELTRGASVRVNFFLQGRPRPLPPEIEGNLLRIGQEALANALKHAQAARVRVELDFRGGKVQLKVLDDGRGFDPDFKTTHCGFGLISMRERAEGMGGHLTISSGAGRGTQVLVAVPAPVQDSEIVSHE
jgi:signal transduction histidine kinase